MPKLCTVIFLPLQLSRMGLTRHLTAAEIVEQAVYARRLLTSEVGFISNVVFMVGEPSKELLDNHSLLAVY